MSEQTTESSVKPRHRGNPANMTRAGLGRPPGVPNKIHVDVKKLAQSYGPDAIRKLAEMGGLIPGVKPATPNSTQAYALDKLLDRAYGKAPQAHSFEGEDGELLGVVMIPMKLGGRESVGADQDEARSLRLADPRQHAQDAGAGQGRGRPGGRRRHGRPELDEELAGDGPG
jgi:hypothetical protein